jgi:hypothetical protein
MFIKQAENMLMKEIKYVLEEVHQTNMDAANAIMQLHEWDHRGKIFSSKKYRNKLK